MVIKKGINNSLKMATNLATHLDLFSSQLQTSALLKEIILYVT